MMVTLAALTFDPLGFVQIRALPSSDTRSITRRVNRVATLDGGVAVNDFGFAEGDRSIDIRFRPTREIDATIGRMMRLHSRVSLTTDEGVFIVALSAYNAEASEARLSILVLERTSE